MAQDVVFRLLAETEKAQKELEAFRKTTKKQLGLAEKSFNSIRKNTSGLSLAFASLAGNLAANAISSGISLVTNAVSGLLSESLAAGRVFEDLNTRLITLTGSTATANALFEELKAFSAGTPFQLPDITNAAAQLKSFGTEVKDIVPTLRSIGDVASAAGANLGELTLIFGQVRAAGKLTGERLLQFQERAVPIGPAIAKTLGVAESSVRQLVSQGKVSFAEFEKAFKSLSDEGEFAFNGIVRASLTFSGAISTTQDNISIFQGTLGQLVTSSDDVKGSLAGTSAVFQELTKIVEENEEQIQALIADAVALIPEAFSVVGRSIIIVNDIFANFQKALNIIGIAIFGFVRFATEGFRMLIEGARNLAEAFDIETPGLDAAIVSLNELEKTSSSVIDSNIKEIGKLGDEQRAFEKTVIEVTDRTTKAFIDASEEFKKQSAAQSEADATRVEAKKAAAVEEIKIDEKRIAAARALAEGLGSVTLLEERFAKENELLRLSLTIDQGIRDEFAELQVVQATEQAKKLSELGVRFDNELQGAKAANRILDNEQEQKLLKARLKGLKQNSKEAQAIIRRQNELEKISFKARLSIAGDFFGGLQTLAQGENREIFEAAKKINTILAIMNGATAVSNALATPPFPLGLALAGVAAVNAGIQIKTIQGAKFQQGITEIPAGFPNDTFPAQLTSGERVVDADTNTELKGFLQRQSTSPPDAAGGSDVSDLLTQILEALSGQQTEIVVNIGNNEVIREVRDGLRSGGSLAV